jgi:heat shock protein HtpX
MSLTTYEIDTELSPAELPDLLNFIHQYYVLPHPEVLRFISKGKIDGQRGLSFRAIDPMGRWWIDVDVKIQRPILVEMRPNSELVQKENLDGLKEDLFVTVQLYEEQVRKTTLYFAWVEGERIIPETMPSMRKRSMDKLFRSNMIVMYVISIALSIILFSFLGWYAPVVIIGFQFFTVIFADKIILKLGNWKIDSRNPVVHLLQYHLPKDRYTEFVKKCGKDIIEQMKAEIYQRTFAQGEEPSCEITGEIFSKYGFECEPDRMSAKKVNVYDIVKRAAEKFELQTPKIVISNTLLPNAAATGPSPNHSTVLITTGLLVQLEDDEILNVVGHEMGHLKGRDPLWLFALMSSEYLLRLYVFLPVMMFSPFLYLMIAMGIVYFIAKFFEARADLYSAVVMGEPEVLAEALRKIGFRRLQLERAPQSRIMAWLMWDPHPPTYFRISRLEKMKSPVKVKHLLIQSAKDVFNGFKTALQ